MVDEGGRTHLVPYGEGVGVEAVPESANGRDIGFDGRRPAVCISPNHGECPCHLSRLPGARPNLRSVMRFAIDLKAWVATIFFLRLANPDRGRQPGSFFDQIDGVKRPRATAQPANCAHEPWQCATTRNTRYSSQSSADG